MKRAQAIATIEQARAEKPGLVAEMDRLIEKRAPMGRIAGFLRHQYGVQVEEADVQAYITESLRAPRQEAEGPRTARAVGSAPVAEPGPGSVAASAPVAPAGVGASGVLTDRIMETFAFQVDELIKEVRNNPLSDAGAMLRVIVLNSMMRDHTQLDEIDMKERFAMDRKYQEAREKAGRAEIARYDAQTKRLKAEAEVESLQAEIAAVEHQLKEADKALQAGKPWDAAEAVKKISAAIGMGQGLVERVEPNY